LPLAFCLYKLYGRKLVDDCGGTTRVSFRLV
jgi:hypothetical protein